MSVYEKIDQPATLLSGIVLTTHAADIVSDEQPIRLTFPPGETWLQSAAQWRIKPIKFFMYFVFENKNLDIQQINENLHYVSTTLTDAKQQKSVRVIRLAKIADMFSNSAAGELCSQGKAMCQSRAFGKVALKLKIKVR